MRRRPPPVPKLRRAAEAIAAFAAAACWSRRHAAAAAFCAFAASCLARGISISLDQTILPMIGGWVTDQARKSGSHV
jgi:hypothetical protein